MNKMSKSPHRYSFQKDSYIKHILKDGKTVDDPAVKSMVEFYETMSQKVSEQESSVGWQTNNLEHDLRSADWMLLKVRETRSYAQNLYAALCNNEFQKLEVIPILKDVRWSCSWRHAGGIVADMREDGDYIDWYCSGLRGRSELDEDDDVDHDYVGEGFITDEIKEDLVKLGWVFRDGDFSNMK